MKTLLNRRLARMLHACAHQIHALLPLAIAALIVLDVLLLVGVRP